MTTFAVLKKKYRKWLNERTLSGSAVTEEIAINTILEIFNDLSLKLLNHSWRSTGIEKFQMLKQVESPPDVSEDQILDELNEKLELRLILEE